MPPVLYSLKSLEIIIASGNQVFHLQISKYLLFACKPSFTAKVVQ